MQCVKCGTNGPGSVYRVVHLRHIAAVVAQARGETLQQLAATATAASRALFKLP